MHCSTTEHSLPHQTAGHSAFPLRQVCGLILLFWLALLPYSVNYLLFHPDERHYTDAGIIMHQTHDYLTPRDADGSPRFLKPILTYWIVAAGFQLFGISPAAARIPFLFLGGLCILVGSLIAHRLFRERRTTLLAAAILSVNPLLILASLASLPDIVQCLLILVSVYGWLGLLTQKFSHADAACAFLGAGLAISTKGIPGLILLTYSLAFLFWNPWIRIERRPLSLYAWGFLGAALALAWYLLIVLVHGDVALQKFFGDQLHARVIRHWWKPLAQIPATLFYDIVLIGPSIFILGALSKSRLRSAWQSLPPPTRASLAYVLGWIVLLIPFLAFVRPFTVRYFQLTVPLVSILFAWIILRGAPGTYRRLCQTFALMLLPILAAVVVIRFGLTEFGLTSPQPLLMLIFSCLTGLFLLRLLSHNQRTSTAAAITAAQGILAVLLGLFWIISPFTIPDQSAEMARFLDRLDIDRTRHDLWYVGKPIMVGKLRMAVRGHTEINSAEAQTLYHLPPDAPVIIALDRIIHDQLDPDEYLSFPISDGWRDLSPFSLITAWTKGNLLDYLRGHREEMRIAIPRTALEQGTVTLKQLPNDNSIADSLTD
jgi:4-amino-4-deoxy-L-arabinose transferase-like glycosyltransferase